MSKRNDWKQWTKRSYGSPFAYAWEPKGPGKRGRRKAVNVTKDRHRKEETRRRKEVAIAPRLTPAPAESLESFGPIFSSQAPQPPPSVEGRPKVEGVLHFDGGCSPNPGPSRCGFVLRFGATEMKRSFDLGEGTCNTAEYWGLINGLRVALAQGVTHLEAYGDSLIVVRGVNGGPKRTGNPRLESLKAEAIRLSRQFASFELIWACREENAEADALATCR